MPIFFCCWAIYNDLSLTHQPDRPWVGVPRPRKSYFIFSTISTYYMSFMPKQKIKKYILFSKINNNKINYRFRELFSYVKSLLYNFFL